MRLRGREDRNRSRKWKKERKKGRDQRKRNPGRRNESYSFFTSFDLACQVEFYHHEETERNSVRRSDAHAVETVSI